MSFVLVVGFLIDTMSNLDITPCENSKSIGKI